MKKTVALFMILILVAAFAFTACENKETDVPDEESGLWKDAVYKEDQTFGVGKKTFTFEVEAEGKQVVFTINTNLEYLGEALIKHKLVEGEEGPYGLYIKKVNGIKADYDENGAYWGFYQDGEYMTSGADTTKIEDGAKYKVVYEKQ